MLYIKIFKAKFSRDTELTGEMDPFIAIKYQGNQYRTSTKWDAGKRPVWNEAFEFPFLDPYQPIEITCYDEDFIANDLIGGTSEMQVNDLLFIDGPRWIEILYDGKPSGHMLLEAKLIEIKYDEFNPYKAD